jgi:hypothetical protein
LHTLDVAREGPRFPNPHFCLPSFGQGVVVRLLCEVVGWGCQQETESAKEEAEGLRAKLRAAVKKGKAIDKQRTDLEATLSQLRQELQVALLCWHLLG